MQPLASKSAAWFLREVQILEKLDWMERRAKHAERVEPWIQPRLERMSRGHRHPVEDFLFKYYPYRPAQLRRWHPGFGSTLRGPEAREYLEIPGYVETANGIIYEGHPLDSARQWEEANRFQSHWCAMRRRECKSCGASIRIGLRPPEEDRAGINSLRFMNWEPVLGGVLTVDHDGYVVVDKQATRGYEPHNCKERRNG